MAVSNILGQCWLCNDFYPLDQLSPVRIPEMIMQVVYDDGRTQTLGTGETVRPTCPNCIPKLSGLIAYRGKTVS